MICLIKFCKVIKCPLCDEVLPYPMPHKLKILFD